MLTRCPHCQTTFRVSQAQLDAARGKVRCGKCQQVFNAREHINPVEANEPAPKVSRGASRKPVSPPPQVDWLQPESKAAFEHIDLSSPASQADIEIPAAQIDFSTLISNAAAPESRLDEEPPFTPENSEQDVADDQAAADNLTADTTRAVTNEPEAASDDSLLSPDLEEAFQNIERHLTLPSIEPAYEEDGYLNARDEQGLEDLQGEIHRQLQTPADEFEQYSHDTEDDAYESVLGYIEEAEEKSEPVSPVEKIELNDLPSDSGNTVNWDNAVHLDPEVPAALRSSMQALEKKKRRHPLLTAFMAILLLVLIVDLGIQGVVFRSYDMATRWPQTRPFLTTACTYLPCVYSGRRDPRKIQLVNRDVRVHPNARHALLISATVVNQAGYAQPYPRLAIKLSDLSGDVVAEREFAPKEYLKTDESTLRLLRPDVPTLITLEVLDPGSEAVNFEFRFL